jgi:hypothetical protein
MAAFEKGSEFKRQIGMRQNPLYPGIEVKSGENQYSRHSHIHRTWSLSYVLHGKTVVSLGTWQSELTEDQFIAVPSGIPHLCSPETGNPFSFIVLYIPVEYLNISMPEFSLPRIGELGSPAVSDFIDSFIQASCKSELDNNSGKLQRILNRNSSPIEGDWGMNLWENRRNPSLEYPQGSRFQLYRHTRKLFGIGRKKISTIEKMEQAKVLLNEGVDLVEIALICGFYDQSHFSRVFKSYTGLTPARYLKK